MTEIKKGDTAFHVPTQTYFTVASRRQNRASGEIALHGRANSYPMSECVLDEREAALDEVGNRYTDLASLGTVLDMARLMIESGECLELLELLGTLTLQQKGQVWAVLTVEQRAALKAAAKKEEQEVAA